MPLYRSVLALLTLTATGALVIPSGACQRGSVPPTSRVSPGAAPPVETPSAAASVTPPPVEAPAATPPPAPSSAGDAPTPPPFPAPTPAELRSIAPQEAWYGVYMFGKKVGHAHFGLRWAGEGGAARAGGGWVVSSEMVMATRAQGSAAAAGGASGPNELRVNDRRVYAGAPPFRLVRAETTRHSSGTTDVRRVQAAPRGLTMTRTLDGRVEVPRLLAPTRETLASSLATSPLHVDRFKPGQQWSATVFSWEREADDTSVVTVRGVARRAWAGLTVDTVRLDARSAGTGLVSHAEVADGGLVLQLEVGPSVVLRLEDERVARSHVVGLDVSHSGVAVARPLGDPRRKHALALRISGPAGWRPPEDGRQEVRRLEADAWQITVRVGSPGPATPAERAAALRPDPIADSDTPAIVEQARALAAVGGGAGGPASRKPAAQRRFVARARRFVYRRLTKRLATHIPAASAVLERGIGDCTEHAWLLTALLRAAKIPARTVFGVAYTGDDTRAFGYHAWVEAAVGGRWVTVDPMWDEQPVDATHVKLAATLEGLTAALGGLRINVLAAPRGEQEGGGTR